MYVYYHTIMYPGRISYQYQNLKLNNFINIVYLPRIVVICLAHPKKLSSEMIYLRILPDLLVMWCVMETSVLGVFSQLGLGPVCLTAGLKGHHILHRWAKTSKAAALRI